MSKRDVKLFLADKEVEFKTIPDILYNFKVDDITSPAAVKNSFSKTIAIPATPKNNEIFGVFYDNQYQGRDNGELTGYGFDPRKRIPFTITINGETYETGYARLDKVTQNKSYYEYSISLFGGLGDFFYELDTSEEGGKRKMSSLIYRQSDYGRELDLTYEINTENLYDAWHMTIDDNSKYSVISFAPCYDGVPSNFSANKVLVNFSGITTLPEKLGSPLYVDGTNVYSTYNSYYLAELPKDYTQAEMREYRSWMQRPVLRVKKSIEAICNPENNGGYTVNLDPEFFYSGNTYFENSWVTLPLLSEIKAVDYSTFDDYTEHTMTRKAMTSHNGGQWVQMGVEYHPVLAANVAKLEANLEFFVSGTTRAFTANTMYTSANIDNISETDGSKRNFSGYFIQMVAYAGTSVDSSVIGVSNGVMITSPVGNDFLKVEETAVTPREGADVNYSLGQFERYDGPVFKWNQQVKFTMDIPAGAKMFGFDFYPVANTTTGISQTSGQVYRTYGYRQRRGYISTHLPDLPDRFGNDGKCTTYHLGTNYSQTPTAFSGLTNAYLGEGRTMGYTGAIISKNMLLDTDYSPCDFLLSYAKLFGLYFVKDPARKIINILTRKNFFQRQNVTDISDYVDRTSVEIKPLSFDRKWYEWGLEPVSSEFESQYENATGKIYGNRGINTGYEFNSDTKNVLDGNIFRSAVEATERGNQFYTVGTDDWSRPWMHNSYKYVLYKTGDVETVKELSIPKSTTVNRINFQEDFNFYDIFSKPVFHSDNNKPTDGKNVLLLYENDVEVGTYNAEGLKAYITDDVPEMGTLNANEACWLYTQGGTRQHPEVYGTAGEIIARRIRYAPHFTRCIVNEGTMNVARSLDFGVPDIFYIPGVGFSSGATLYNFFWEDYMEEIFSKNSRIMKCKMLIKEIPSIDWLRRFYYFDGCIWRMTNIKDWNVSADKLTEVEFVKVQDIGNYTSITIAPGNLFLSIGMETITAAETNVPYTVTCVDGENWNITASTYTTLDVSSGNTDWEGTWSIPANMSNTGRTFSIRLWDSDDAQLKTVYQDGHHLNVYRCDASGNPVENYEINKNGETVYFFISSALEWSFYASPDTAFISSMSCEPSGNTPTEGTIISVVVPRNPSIINDRTTTFILKADATGYQFETPVYTQPDRGL